MLQELSKVFMIIFEPAVDRILAVDRMPDVDEWYSSDTGFRRATMVAGAIAFCAVVAVLLASQPASAQSSPGFHLNASVVSCGGSAGDGPAPASTSFVLEPSTIAEPVAGTSGSTSYTVRAGFAALEGSGNPVPDTSIFTDGFESGDLSKWSSAVGG